MAHHAIVDSGLLAAGLRPATRRVYARQVLAFTNWCRDNQLDFLSLDELDAALAEYISTCYLDGGSKATASNAFYGVCVFEPHANKQTLPWSFRCLRGWLRAERPPLTRQSAGSPRSACACSCCVKASGRWRAAPLSRTTACFA
jgi:hypothetical protein